LRRWLVLSLVAAVIGTGCASSAVHRAGGGRAEVVAAFYPVAAAAQRVGGRCVSVNNLTPAGAEPHDLELVPDQVDAIQDADLVLVMGHGFQPALEKAAAQRDGPTVEILDRLGADGAGRAAAGETGRAVRIDPSDPHVWLDPVLYSQLVDTVTASLVKVAPECRATFERNATRFKAVIDRVDREYRDGLRDCRRRTIVTAHQAFGYLAEQYGLDQVGIAGIVPDQEPNAQRIAEVADLVERRGITTIFTEALVSPRVAEALAREAGGVRTATLNPLEGLTDRQIARGEDWASVMRENLAKIRTALGCRTP
jgi:zinc transport system substrate-binding protein